jgi:hypothetical protein
MRGFDWGVKFGWVDRIGRTQNVTKWDERRRSVQAQAGKAGQVKERGKSSMQLRGTKGRKSHAELF